MQCLLQQLYAPSVSGLNIKSLHSLLCIQQMQTQNPDSLSYAAQILVVCLGQQVRAF